MFQPQNIRRESGFSNRLSRCREPLTPEQAASPEFVRGVSCPYCIE